MDIVRKGKCINFGNCAKADNHEIIELSFTEDFVCPECNSDLQEIKTKKRGLFPAKTIASMFVVSVCFFVLPQPPATATTALIIIIILSSVII